MDYYGSSFFAVRVMVQATDEEEERSEFPVKKNHILCTVRNTFTLPTNALLKTSCVGEKDGEEGFGGNLLLMI